jgi:hypothetical protein
MTCLPLFATLLAGIASTALGLSLVFRIGNRLLPPAGRP